MRVESKLQDILNSVTAKPGRFRLEPYGVLIDALCRRGLTYRDIAAIEGLDQCRIVDHEDPNR